MPPKMYGWLPEHEIAEIYDDLVDWGLIKNV